MIWKMNVQFPIQSQVAEALLVLLYLSGGSEGAMRSTSTYVPLAAHFGLSDRVCAMTRHDVSGDGDSTPKWNNLVQFARWDLVKARWLTDARHGIWKLSAKGRAQAQRVLEMTSVGHWAKLNVVGFALGSVAFKEPSELTLEDLGL